MTTPGRSTLGAFIRSPLGVRGGMPVMWSARPWAGATVEFWADGLSLLRRADMGRTVYALAVDGTGKYLYTARQNVPRRINPVTGSVIWDGASTGLYLYDAATDGDGNCLFLRSTSSAIFNPSGDLIWTFGDVATFYRCAMDSLGDIYMSYGMTDQNCSLYKVRPVMPTGYTNQWSAVAIDMDIRRVIVDHDDNVIICGRGANEDRAGNIQKYSAAGNLLWAAEHGAWAASADFPYYEVDYFQDIGCDSDNNIIAVGTRREVSEGVYITTVKYDAIGNVLWTADYGAPTGTGRIVRAVACDRQNRIYTSGYEASNGTDYQWVLYKPDGSVIKRSNATPARRIAIPQ